ncbi:MAG: hypothetical protein ACO39Y_07890, partial [Ilumatobacteraceae bacterium]
SSITWFGPCCPITPSELTSPYSFPIGNQPMYAVGAVKRAVDDGLSSTLADGLLLERRLFVESFRSDDSRIGVQSFLANGPGRAEFTGR